MATSYLGDQKPVSYLGSAPAAHSSMIYLNQASIGDLSHILSGNSSSIQNHAQILSGGSRSEVSFLPPISNQIRDPMTVDQSFQSQGLSLSLATQIQSPAHIPSYQYQHQGYSSLLSNYLSFSGKGNDFDDNQKAMDGSFYVGNNNAFDAESFSSSQNSINQKGFHSSTYQQEPGFSSAVLNPKYLKAAQELLDEVVNVQKALKQSDSNKDQSSNRIPSEPSESVTNPLAELSPAGKQDLQTKKSKLLSMLNEFDRRYRQYYHQMKIVASSFDMIAGHGAAKAYTALALQTISRYFRCIRDKISGQIQITQRTLGEQETGSNSQGETIPRLRFVDHQLRQQRALQQLGVMRNAWRPQRGLPESSVSILRAWLFEHFLHPYPKDSEKVMLAKQTDLTRNQVANWFINARVRLWKPMIEEMYKEEYSELQTNSNTSLENATKPLIEQNSSASDDGEDLQESLESKFVQSGGTQQFNPVDEEPNITLERPGYENPGVKIFSTDQRPNVDGSNLYAGTFGDAMYDLPELNDFGVNRQVTLALGLRRHENASVASSAAPETPDFHCVDAGNQQDRFGNSHVLHDFVV